MSKTFIVGAKRQEFELEGQAAEEMLDRVICSREQFSFQICPSPHITYGIIVIITIIINAQN